jgi:hypothetical protein
MIVTAGRPLAATPEQRHKDIVELLGRPEEMLKDEGPYRDTPVIRESNLIKARTPPTCRLSAA